MPTEENPHAGQGAVVLDIGGDIGALLVTMPAHMDGLEVEIIPTGTDTRTPGSEDRTAHDHHHGDGGHHHHHDADHDHADVAPAAPPHVAVVARPAPDGSTIHSLVYGELHEGAYDLYVRPGGPVRMTATVTGGEVTELRWPDWEPAN